ncbi:MAG: SpoIIE family protein phosphatase [Clostridia bacterium]|nr:SpoIIE family protein phosphatase [Clostridia bacterium]
METLRRFADRTRLAAYSLNGSRAAGRLLTGTVLPFLGALLFAAAWKLSPVGLFSRTALGGYIPPALALALMDAFAAAELGEALLPAALGTALGCLVSGRPSGCVSAALLYAALLILGRKRLSKLCFHTALLAVLLVSLPVGILLHAYGALSARTFAAHLAGSGAALIAAFLDTGALLSMRAAAKNGLLPDEKLVLIAAFAGEIAVAFGRLSPLGLGLGVCFLAAFLMNAAYSGGVSAVAAAAVAAALRVFGTSGDILLIAVLCTCTLGAALCRPLGRLAVAAGFSLPALLIFALMHGSGTLGAGEILFSSVVFLVLPRSLAVLREEGRSPRTERLERRLIYQNYKLTVLSDVLQELASLFESGEEPADGFINRQLSGVAESLVRLSSPGKDPGHVRFRLDIAASTCPRLGEKASGDSWCIRDFDGVFLAALSDGMGSGSEAARESSQAVQLLADLVTCGFRLEEAAECVNRLLLLREGGEMYATLDAVLFDPMSGTMRLAKHGAPPCCLVRGGRVSQLSGEALPVGIVEEARTAVSSVRMKRGDAVIMMTDGAMDVLGREPETLNERIAGLEADAAAKLLTELASGLGGRDDMTVIVAKVS